jgi:ubiquitin-activating enzyme E1
MNAQMRIEAQSNRLGPETAHIYHEDFYRSLSGVCNALDSVPGRIFSDSQCVRYGLPLLESGTLGTKANMQIVIPSMTENYGAQQNSPSKGVPMCTLHHFPSTIEHTCVWARDIFAGLFEQPPQSANSFVQGNVDVRKMRRDDAPGLMSMLNAVHEYMVTEPARNFDDCIRWARVKFDEFFNLKIRDLTAQFPIDHLTEEGGRFWSDGKRFPSPVEYDPADPYHSKFVTAAALLRARVFGVAPEGNVAVRAAAVAVDSSARTVDPVTITDAADNQSAPVQDQDGLDRMIAELSPLVGSERRFFAQDFEKDDDSNGHMDFIEAATNIRAINYQIQPKDRMALKKIAGNIIPSIATTSAMICGFVALEMYKVHATVPKTIHDFRFGAMNMGTNAYILTEPPACRKKKCILNGTDYNLWTTWPIEGDLTLAQFIDAANAQYHVTPDTLTIGMQMIYISFVPKPVDMARKITDLMAQYKIPPLCSGQHSILIHGSFVDDEGKDTEAPPFSLRIH